MTATKNLIEVRDLTKSYGSVRALDSVSFDVGEGEILGFLGPNGAGKSTTLRILSGFLPGDAGTVRVAGHDVRSASIDVRASIGYLPEGVPLYTDLRVIEYLRFRAKLKGIPRAQRARAISKVLDATQTGDVRRKIISTLSRGYRQRVGLADALLSESPVLILDEPTVGLDPEQVRQFRKLLQEVGRDRTVILSTHILSEVELVCSSVVIITGGRIVARDTAEGIKRSAGNRSSVVAEISGPERDVRRRLESLAGVQSVDAGPVIRENASIRESTSHQDVRRYSITSFGDELRAESVYDIVREHGWSLSHLDSSVQTLEDVFIDIVGKESA